MDRETGNSGQKHPIVREAKANRTRLHSDSGHSNIYRSDAIRAAARRPGPGYGDSDDSHQRCAQEISARLPTTNLRAEGLPLWIRAKRLPNTAPLRKVVVVAHSRGQKRGIARYRRHCSALRSVPFRDCLPSLNPIYAAFLLTIADTEHTRHSDRARCDVVEAQLKPGQLCIVD